MALVTFSSCINQSAYHDFHWRVLQNDIKNKELKLGGCPKKRGIIAVDQVWENKELFAAFLGTFAQQNMGDRG